jgi:hypothetical protein
MYPQNNSALIFNLIFCWYFADTGCIRNISADKYFGQTPVADFHMVQEY